ncbi:unnamed protein product [Lampetra fluviatilis]
MTVKGTASPARRRRWRARFGLGKSGGWWDPPSEVLRAATPLAVALQMNNGFARTARGTGAGRHQLNPHRQAQRPSRCYRPLEMAPGKALPHPAPRDAHKRATRNYK